MQKFLISLYLAATLFCFTNLAQALDLKLTWNPNIESDLAGYRIYHGAAKGGPYTKVGELTPIPSPSFAWPIPAGTEGMQYFVVTAYDQAGNESSYSNEASLYVDNVAPGAPKGLQIVIIITLP